MDRSLTDRIRALIGRVAVVAGAALALSGVHAQGPSEEWKLKHQRHEGAYSEGTGVERNVAAAPLELVSFVVFREPFDPASDTHLAVDFYAASPSAYTIQARELVLSEYYWMQTKREFSTKGRNVFDKWSTKEVLLHDNIDPANVGVVVWLDQNSDPIRVAAAVLRKKSSPAPSMLNQYEATFVPELPLPEVSFSVQLGCEPSQQRVEVTRGSLGRQYAGIPFAVPFSLADGTYGAVALTLQYRTELDKQTRSFHYCFLHAPKGQVP